MQTLPKQVRDRLQTLIAKGIGQSIVIAFWSMGGTPKTHLVPLFCSADKLAVDTKHILSSALTVVIQKYQVTSLYGVSPILHRIKKCSYGAYGAKDKPGDIPLPRSLTRSARSFGCGERYRLTGGAEISWHLPGRSLTGKQEGHGEAVFP